MKIDFKGKTVLITGATRGIGKEIAAHFRASGANLLLTGTDRRALEKLDRFGKGNSLTRYFHLDFLDDASIERFLSEVRSFKKIDVCINNAGINRLSYVYDTPVEAWDRIMRVNLRGPFILSKEIGALMKKNNYGRIVNIASIFGVITKEKRAAYTAAKSGLIGLTKTAAIDLAPYGVLANAVSPGFIMTDLTRKILTGKEIRDLRSAIPVKRLGNSKDIASVVLFLASGLNTYVTGQNIIVDGGYVDI